MTTRPDHAKIRRHGRHKVDVRLSVSTARDDKSLHFSGTVLDIGLGGLTAHIAGDLEHGERLSLEFTLPYSQVPLNINAVVRNRSDSRYGLEFVDVSPNQNSAIQRLCDTLTLLEG